MDRCVRTRLTKRRFNVVSLFHPGRIHIWKFSKGKSKRVDKQHFVSAQYKKRKQRIRDFSSSHIDLNKFHIKSKWKILYSRKASSKKKHILQHSQCQQRDICSRLGYISDIHSIEIDVYLVKLSGTATSWSNQM